MKARRRISDKVPSEFLEFFGRSGRVRPIGISQIQKIVPLTYLFSRYPDAFIGSYGLSDSSLIVISAAVRASSLSPSSTWISAP